MPSVNALSVRTSTQMLTKWKVCEMEARSFESHLLWAGQITPAQSANAQWRGGFGHLGSRQV